MEAQQYTPRVEQVLSMNGGRGDTSYAKNSIFQRKVMYSARHIVEQSAKELCTSFSSTKHLTIAEMGCATGPNALLAAKEIVNIVSENWRELGHVHDQQTGPEFLVLLNDLPRNDFNSLFSSMYEDHDPISKDGRECFVAAAPGSFYGRLFPSHFLHFVHVSNALHWLSQAPEGLIDENGEAINKANICIGNSSSLSVRKVYEDQFKKDFRAFLKARSEELMPGGNMVLTFNGSHTSNAPFKIFDVFGLSLAEMAKEGLIKESKLDKFNLPFHAASEEQISEVIINEGHFKIRKVEIVKMSWDAGIEEHEKCGRYRGEFLAKYMRAVVEPLLKVTFGEGVMDELFRRLGLRFNELMDVEDCLYHYIVVWLTRIGHADG